MIPPKKHFRPKLFVEALRDHLLLISSAMGKCRSVSQKTLKSSAINAMQSFDRKKPTTYRKRQEATILSGLRALRAPAVPWYIAPKIRR